LVMSVVAPPGIGAFYALLLLYNPVHTISLVFTLLFSGTAGFLVGLGADWGKVRRPILTFFMGAFAGILMIYVSWVVWIRVTSNFSQFVLNPIEIQSVLSGLLEKGIWQIFSWKPSGGILFSIWILEAAMSIFFSALMAWGVIGRVPFCERCGDWIEERVAFQDLCAPRRFHKLNEDLKSGRIFPLLKLNQAKPGAREFTRLELSQCKSCNEFSLLNLRHVKEYKSEKGRVRWEDEVLENFIISKDDYGKLRNRFCELVKT